MCRTIAIIALMSFLGCHSHERPQHEEAAQLPQPDRELLYHYSVWSALVNGIYDGELTIPQLRQRGDLALGTYNSLDGELVMLDGELYQVGEDGVVRQPPEDLKIPYANITWFDPDIRFTIEDEAGYEGLKQHIEANMPSDNYFYAFRIPGSFRYVKCGTVHRQERPYMRSLADLIAARPVFERADVQGTLVGFYCPDFVGNVNTPGYHLHFISDDRTFGGHVMEFLSSGLEVQMDLTPSYMFDLPQTEAYMKSGLEQEFEYGR